MANNCDDSFQDIQREQQNRKALDDVLRRAMGGRAPGPGEDIPAVFLRDRSTGEEVEVNFDRLFKEALMADSDAMQDFAARAIGERRLPAGDQGWFINTVQLVDRLGFDDAQQMVALLETFNNSWERNNPTDFLRATAINDREAFAQRLADGFATADYVLDKDGMAQAITTNLAPFLSILDQQTRLQVFADVTRVNLSSKLALIRKMINETGLPPALEVKQEFIDAYRKAVFANRSAALSRRISGQLLQQLQNNPGMDITGYVGRIRGDIFEQATRIFGDKDLVTADSLAGRVAEASSRGVDGLDDLARIADTMEEELADPAAPPVDSDFEHNWRRNAKAYVKDSQLFSGNTQLINNYLSGKLIFAAEGVRKAGENGVRLRAMDLTQPIGTKWHRKLLSTDKTLEGYRVAAEAGIVAHDVVRQSWKESLRDHFMEADTPFAGNPDTLGTKGTQDIAEQYDAALKVLYGENIGDDGKGVGRSMYQEEGEGGLTDVRMTSANEPSLGNYFGSLGDESPVDWPLLLRDKAFVGMKLMANHLIEKATGARLPVTSALQMMGAVDHRAGLRVHMTTRANELMLQRIQAKPSESWADRRAWVRGKLDDELYQATPTPQNIRDARTQFPAMQDASDDEIASYLAAEKVGAPVMATPEQKEAFNFSGYARLQNRPEGFAGKVDDGVMGVRGNRYVDAVFPYWRSPFNQYLWTFRNSMPPLREMGKIVFSLAKGQEPSTEQLAKVAGGWTTFLGMVGMFTALDAAGVVEGNGPLEPAARKQWLAEGHIPNSLFGIPLLSLGALPVLQTMFLYKDIKDSFANGEYTKYDQYNGFMGIGQVFVGQLMRQTSLGQFAQLAELMIDPTERRWKQLAGYLANGQLNPASGPMRDMERFGSLRANNLYQARIMEQEDKELQDEVDPNDPLEAIRDNLRSFAYFSVPSVAAAMGQPIKDTDYLGYKLRLPEGMFRNEWQEKMGVGTPAIWPKWAPISRASRSPVHAVLDSIGMLNPPPPLVSGRMDGILMGEGLEKEYNKHVSTVKGAAIGDDPVFGQQLTWRRNAKEVSMDGRDRSVESIPFTVGLNNNGLMDRLTKGKTLEQALRGLFASQTWKNLEADPDFTTNRRVTDRPLKEVMALPGPRMVKVLHEYYDHLAQNQVEMSTTPAAAEWRQLRDAKVAKQNEQSIEELTRRAQSLVGQ
jgi:hypothetical protein